MGNANDFYGKWNNSENARMNLARKVEQLEQELHDALNEFGKKLLEEQLRAQRWHYIAQCFYDARFSQDPEQVMWASEQFESQETEEQQ